MSKELLIADAGLVDAATLTTPSTTAASQGIGKLQVMDPGDPCRFTTGSGAIIADLGAAPAINLVALLAVVGADSDDTWRVRAAATEAALTASPGYDSGTLSLWAKAGLGDWPFHHAALYLSPAQAFQWWRIDVASDASIDIGRLMIDAAYVSPRAVDVVYRINEIDSTETRRSQTGGLFVVAPGEIWREPEYQVSALTRAQVLEAWQPLLRKVGRRRDVFAWMDPGDYSYLQEEAVHAVLQDAEHTPVLVRDFHRARARFEELLPNMGIGAV